MLLRMQADQIMIVVKEEEKAQLKQAVTKKSLSEILKPGEDSSMCETDDQITFLENLQGAKEQPSDLELELIAGLFANKDAIDKTLLERPKKKKKIRAPKGYRRDDSQLDLYEMGSAQKIPEDADNKIRG